MRVVSLFSGAGGLDLGFKLAGNDIVWANDIDENACATYRENIGDHIVCEDIKDIDIKSIPDADIVIGGFPCQGFSLANLRRSIDDERNQLYKFFYSVIKTLKPKFFVAENVKGILSLGGGSVIHQIFIQPADKVRQLVIPFLAALQFRLLIFRLCFLSFNPQRLQFGCKGVLVLQNKPGKALYGR